MVNSPNAARNRNSKLTKILKRTRLLYISLGLSAATAAYIVGLTVQKVQRNAASRNRYTRNLENYGKYCGWTGPSRKAPKNFQCVKPVRPASMALPKGFFGHVADIAMASKYLVITMAICAMISTLSLAVLKWQQTRLARVAVGRAAAESGLAKRSGETTVRTAEKLEDVTAECLKGAKELIKALNTLDRDLASAALNNSPNKNSKIRKIKDSKAYLEEALAPALARTAAAGRAQQFFLDTLTSEERMKYNEQLNQFIGGSAAMVMAIANQQHTTSVTAITGRAIAAATNTGKKLAIAYGTGGASLLLTGRQTQSPRLAIQARRTNQGSGSAARTPSPPRRRSPLQIRNKTPSPPRRRSPSKSPNSRNANKSLNNLLRQFK